MHACAAVFDGHGGISSAVWLQQHLYEDVLARLSTAFLQPDPAAQEVPGRPAVVRPSKVEQTMVEVFQQADKELLQHLLGAYMSRGGWCWLVLPGWLGES